MSLPGGELAALHMDSPLGELQLVATADGLAALRFCGCGSSPAQGPACTPLSPADAAPAAVRRHLLQAQEELAAYFAGSLRIFSLPLAVRGTPFQLRVWQALRDIPYGETWSYARLAAHIGRPGACRAVGNANGRNPLPIIIPCHRVIRTGGELGGYSAGLDIKRFLLALEGGQHKKSPLAGA